MVFRFIRLLPALFRVFSRDLSTEEWPETTSSACRDHPPDGKQDRKAQPWEKCLGTQQPHNSEPSMCFRGQVAYSEVSFTSCFAEPGPVLNAFPVSTWLLVTQALERDVISPFFRRGNWVRKFSLPRVTEMVTAETWTPVCLRMGTLVKIILFPSGQGREFRVGHISGTLAEVAQSKHIAQ